MNAPDDSFQYHLGVGIHSDGQTISDAMQAVGHFSRAMEIAPDIHWTRDLHQRRSEAYCRLGDHRLAIGDGLAALSLRPDDASTYRWLGICHDHVGEYASAIHYLHRAVRLDPTPIHVADRGAARHHQGDRAGAMRDFELAIDLSHRQSDSSTDIGQIHLYRGVAAYIEGDLGPAREDIDTAVVALPLEPHTHVALSLLHVAEGDRQGALACLGHAVALRPYDRWLGSVVGLLSAVAAAREDPLGTGQPLSSPTVAEAIATIIDDLMYL